MPANLFVVIFPRKVKAHPIYVTRKEPKEKPKRQWSVGGLRSPPGVFPAREGRGGRGDKKQSTTSQLPRQFANIAMSRSTTEWGRPTPNAQHSLHLKWGRCQACIKGKMPSLHSVTRLLEKDFWQLPDGDKRQTKLS